MGVRVVGEEENRHAMALTAPFLASFDAVIDFTTPEAAVSNMRACLANGARMVVGTTGWYDHLDDMRSLAARKGAGFLVWYEFLDRRADHVPAGKGNGRSRSPLSLQDYRDPPR